MKIMWHHSNCLVMLLTLSCYVNVMPALRTITQPTYKAAVFDKAPMYRLDGYEVPSRAEALELVMPHLEIFREQAISAEQQVWF